MNPQFLTAARRGATFIYPSGDTPETAILTSGFRRTRTVRCIANVRELGSAGIAAEALAGPIHELRYVANLGLAMPSRGIVAMTWKGMPALSEADREYLWDRFGVPVFEQYLDQDNALLATECDAHSGLHLVADVENTHGYVLETTPCPCGDKRPRLVAAAAFETQADELTA